MSIQVVILAAGQGKRMRSRLPKVLQLLAGKPMLAHVLATAKLLAPDKSPIVIVGHGGDALRNAFSVEPIQFVTQEAQLGTGDAVRSALPLLSVEDQVLILYGDVPLVSEHTLKQLIATTPANQLGMLTAVVENPTGYGRIKRDDANKVQGIVEEKDATPLERTILEVNPGIYLVPARFLKNWLPKLTNHNQQNEFYLTDIIAFAVAEAIPVHTVLVKNSREICGINDKLQLAQVERLYQQQQAERLLQEGVTLADPARFDVRGNVTIGNDVFIDVNVILEGDVTIGANCEIGANVILRNVTLGENVVVRSHSVIEGATIAANAMIGPFARIRPGTVLAEGVHIGNFVEVKNSIIGKKTKASHLSYIGDSEIGTETNIGAGTITCNYDGFHKSKTIIGDRVMIGSDTTLIAPVKVNDDAYVATATTVRADVPAGALVFNPRDQQIRTGWTEQYRNKNEK